MFYWLDSFKSCNNVARTTLLEHLSLDTKINLFATFFHSDTYIYKCCFHQLSWAFLLQYIVNFHNLLTAWMLYCKTKETRKRPGRCDIQTGNAANWCINCAILATVKMQYQYYTFVQSVYKATYIKNLLSLFWILDSYITAGVKYLISYWH